MPLLVRPATATEYDTIGALTADVFARERLAGAAYVETLRDAPTRAALPAPRIARPGLELLAYSLDLWPQDSSSDSPSHVSTTRSAS